MFLEHNHVYTLGRGADERHLTFLQEDSPTNTKIREKLARSNRGPGSARLSIDRHVPLQAEQHGVDLVDSLCQTAEPVIAPNGAPIYRIERGGDVTYHGPGQLVAYPLLDLKREPFQADLHWFLRMVEEIIIRSLNAYDIEGKRDDINTGVWVDERKVAAVGVSSSRWITTHGFAINVRPDLDYFDTSVILPCGIEDREVTSIAEILKKRGHDNTPSVHEVAETVLKQMQQVFGIQSDTGMSLT